jgi:8-oxo-dGTP pyrophosphatase MutT (NUDIX family)
MDNNFSYKIDNYNCVWIDLRKSDNSHWLAEKSEEELRILIKKQLINIENLSVKVKAVWIYIPIELAHLIHHFTAEKYIFHHTENGRDLLLSKLLNTSANNLPNFATHYLGVGGLITNEDGKFLLVKEKNALKQLKGLWKIPTGHANKGETIEAALKREIFEETGLNVVFVGVINFREAFPYIFDCSDIYFVCLCTVENLRAKIDVDKGGELEECEWFNKEEIVELMKNNKISPDVKHIFKSIWNGSKSISSLTLKVSNEIQFFKSRMIFHNPRF